LENAEEAPAEIRKRIIPVERIGETAEALRKEGKKIVTANGAFDVLHPGHVYFLSEAKKQGDVLIVGLNSDESIRQNKGEGRPVNDEKSRAVMLAALKPVDYVAIFREKTPDEFIKKVKPAVHCNGEEYGENCVEAETVRRIGARLHLIKRVGGWSTSDVLKRLEDR